ncbi:cytochrome P450 [Biscogniauxia mediterranea]|nr:cytochrome P450 [Biscogniauxia mediterranea]
MFTVVGMTQVPLWLAKERAVPGVTAFTAAVAVILIYFTSWTLYSLYIHPLHAYPGPKLSAISRIPYWYACLTGNQVRWMTRLHKKYGSVVRLAPDDLSYTDGRAWRDIHVVPKGSKENPKEVKFHAPSANGIPTILVLNDRERHAAVRRVFSPAFSEKALKAQESLFQGYANAMIARAREKKTVNLTQLYNFTTFDVMADLAFGKSLGLLEGEDASWVSTIFASISLLPWLQFIEFYPLTRKLYALLEPKSIAKRRLDHFHYTTSRVDKRLKEGSDKQDLWKFVIDSNQLTLGDMHINAELFMSAGTETTASLLTGLTYYLLKNPDKLKILVDEIRGKFRGNEEITFEALAGMPYLNACIREGLRVYPPVPTNVPREIAEGGNFVLGKWLPAGTRVSVHHQATYRSPANFKNPDKFAPERWLGDPEYKDDNREAHQPFNVGPRNCLGMNMAWHEMRLLLAKMLFNFDIETDEGPEWLDQDVYIIWDRKPLVCRLAEVAPRQ